MNKTQRQALVLAKIKENVITTQEELVSCLLAAGAEVTQATVSRDIRELQIIKALDSNGINRYTTMQKSQEQPEQSLLNVFLESTLEIRHAGNLVVIKTLPGMASASATLIDSLHFEEVVGSIAGDDTIFIACVSNSSADHIVKELNRFKKNRTFMF